MAITLGTCSPAEFPRLVAALDAEFISGRGRELSLAQRFPHALARQRIDDIYVLREDGEVAACVVTRPFNWITEIIWRGAMIGMVYTVASARGRGFGSRLLDAVTDKLSAANIDFAVLWSGLHGFYERRGWLQHDTGVFGTVRAAVSNRIEAATAYDQTRSGNVERDSLALRAIPMPALRCHRLEAAGGSAIYGEAGDCRFLYELSSSPAAWPALWAGFVSERKRHHVNAQAESASHRWLSVNVDVDWQAQTLAYWRMLSPRAAHARYQTWYIPYFDRI